MMINASSPVSRLFPFGSRYGGRLSIVGAVRKRAWLASNSARIALASAASITPSSLTSRGSGAFCQGAATGSSLKMRPTAWAAATVANVGFDRLRKNFSVGSTVVSPLMVTAAFTVVVPG
jgi:hypothetical protein